MDVDVGAADRIGRGWLLLLRRRIDSCLAFGSAAMWRSEVVAEWRRCKRRCHQTGGRWGFHAGGLRFSQCTIKIRPFTPQITVRSSTAELCQMALLLDACSKSIDVFEICGKSNKHTMEVSVWNSKYHKFSQNKKTKSK